MPIETKNPQWEASIYAWQKSRDAMGGEKIIKSKNTKYLDMPTGMIGAKEGVSVGGSGTEQIFVGDDNSLPGDDRQYDPTWHSNPAYRAYLRRAKFPDIPAFTVRGLLGLATKKECDIELPPSLAYLEEKFTKDGKSLGEFYKFALNEVLQTGRFPCAVETEGTGFTVVAYTAESNTNWRDGDFFVFEEKDIVDDADIFACDTESVYRLLYIDKDGYYASSLLKGGETDLPIEPDANPDISGKKYDKLPVVIIGSTNLDSDVDQIPIEGIVDCSIQIYRKTADLSNSQYMSCNPTLVGIGVNEEDRPTSLGSTIVWLIGNTDARVEYPKTDTSALSHVKEDINDLFEEAANYGARLLGSPKKGTESAESIRLQHGASGATLASVIDTVSMGIVSLIKIMMEWGGIDGEVSFSGSKEFGDMTLSWQEQKELRESWLSEGISQETYLYNMKRAGLFPEDRTIDDELELIDFNNNGDNDEPDIVLTNPLGEEDDDEEEMIDGR